jgi:hypothetical protein
VNGESSTRGEPTITVAQVRDDADTTSAAVARGGADTTSGEQVLGGKCYKTMGPKSSNGYSSFGRLVFSKRIRIVGF